MDEMNVGLGMDAERVQSDVPEQPPLDVGTEMPVDAVLEVPLESAVSVEPVVPAAPVADPTLFEKSQSHRRKRASCR